MIEGKKIGYKLPMSRSSDSYKFNQKKCLFGYQIVGEMGGGGGDVVID